MKNQFMICAAGILLATQLCVRGQASTAGPVQLSPDGIWQTVPATPSQAGPGRPWLQPGKFRAFKLAHGALGYALVRAPKEFTAEGRSAAAVLTLPMPDGSFARFRIVESPIMEPELAAKFPEIKTYAGQGLDDPTASIRCDVTPAGFHARVLSADGPISIGPLGMEAPDVHVSLHERDVSGAGRLFNCTAETPAAQAGEAQAPQPGDATAHSDRGGASAQASAGQQLRIYQLAMAAQGEYTQFHGGTVAGAMAAIVTSINRVNAVFEREVAVRLVLVANNDLIIYTDPLTDPYTENTAEPLVLDQNQANLDAVIGSANYDVGHVLSTGGGGRALGRVCVAGSKARGATGLPIPVGPWFDEAFLSHELGHQFGASHTWNGTGDYCTLGEYAANTAYEPGSGSTIMSYSVTCGSGDNLQPPFGAYFHAASFDQINNYVTGGVGQGCQTPQATGNTPPTVNAGLSYVIPARTPFVLKATGSDADGDLLTYCWEQRDLGPRQPATGPGSADNGSSPLFRSFPPVTNAARIFPQLSDILNNTTTIGEQLPSRNRVLHFRVTARDGRTGVNNADMQVTVVSNAGPFRVVAPNAPLIWSGTQTVLWEVAGTTATPINAASVNVLLSTNGGYDFPITLAANTPNDGAHLITLPDVYAPQARVKVEAVGKIFFDISRTDFIIVPNAPVLRPLATVLLAEGCAPTNGVIDPGETVVVQFSLENIGGGPVSNLIVSLLPTGGVLSPSGAQTTGPLAGGGAWITNSFSFTADPALACGATMTATLHVSDGSTDLGTLEFPLHLGTAALNSTTVANLTPVVVPSATPVATNYPSAIVVSNFSDVIGHVSVTLSNVTHSFPYFIRALLVSPGGQSVLLLSDAFFSAVTNITLTLDDLAPASLIEVTQVVSGSYQPTDGGLQPADLPYPAPAGPYARELSVFKGANPNGIWRLFLAGYGSWPDNSGFYGGWALNITTSNAVCCSSHELTLSMADSPDPVLSGNPLSYTLSVTNLDGTAASGVIVSNLLPAGVTFASASASQGACTNTGDAIVCDLGTLAAGAGATVTLQVLTHAGGMLTNTASVTRDGAGDNPSGNTANALTTVLSPFTTVAISDLTITEGNSGTSTADFPVSLSVSNLEIVTLAFATTNGLATLGSDYFATNGTLTFLPGETAKTITVPVIGDILDETNETFFVRLSDPTDPSLRLEAKGAISDDDPLPAMSIADVSVVEGNAGTTNAGFTLNLSGPSSFNVSARAVTSNGSASTAGSDYFATNVVVTFPPGATNRPLSVRVRGDTFAEINETFLVTLSSPTNASLSDAQGVGTILDDDFKLAATEISGNDVRLRFATVAGRSYRVERTTNLAAPVVWESAPGLTNVAGTGGTVEVFDIGAAGEAQRYYRAVLQ